MVLLEDSRQQESKHKRKHDYFRKVGVYWTRTALYSGDYTLPTDQSVCVDTKFSIMELIGDIQVKQMPKSEIKDIVYEICEKQHIGFDLAEQIYHAICDKDEGRFAEKEINDLCFQNLIPEGVLRKFQALYVKRHGFFHRGLKRAQNSGIKLIVLVENEDGVTNIDDLFRWHNPRLDMWTNSSEVIGYWRNGKPRYKRVRKYPNAMTGEKLAKACLTMQLRYGVEFKFCRPEDAGKRILELLGVS